jgi:hypothetical protein
MDNAEAK